MATIFVLSHRLVSAGYTSRLAAELRAHFDSVQDSVQLRRDNDFVRLITSAVSSCSVLIVVIGPDWLATDRVFHREVATALTGKTLVLPVLVGGATSPRAEDLPDELKPLARRQAHQLTDTRWDHDVKQLIAHLVHAFVFPEQVPADSAAGALDLEEVTPPAPHREPRPFQTGPEKARATGSVGVPEPADLAEPAVATPPAEPSQPMPVLLGASAPTTARPGEQFTARFAAYVKAVEREVEEQLAELSPRATPHMGMATCRWRPGTTVKVRLTGAHLQVEPQDDTFVWEGDRQFVSFAVTVAPDAPMGGTVLKFEAIIEGVVVARLLLDLEIAPETAAAERRFATVEPARTAFASYASPDRDEVLGRVASLTNAAGLQVFLDSASLRTGKRWQEQLATAIKDHELFLLFWSTSASRSKWVKWEWQTALREKGLDAIQPHPLEPVAKAPPPRELEALHFGDAYVLIREAYRGVRPS